MQSGGGKERKGKERERLDSFTYSFTRVFLLVFRVPQVVAGPVGGVLLQTLRSALSSSDDRPEIESSTWRATPGQKNKPQSLHVRSKSHLCLFRNVCVYVCMYVFVYVRIYMVHSSSRFTNSWIFKSSRTISTRLSQRTECRNTSAACFGACCRQATSKRAGLPYRRNFQRTATLRRTVPSLCSHAPHH